MSYILDALNKSEQERAKNRRPGLRDDTADSDKVSFSTRQIIIALLALIFINSLGVYWYFGDAMVQNTDAVRHEIKLNPATLTQQAPDSSFPLPDARNRANQAVAASLPDESIALPSTLQSARSDTTKLTAIKSGVEQPGVEQPGLERPDVEITAHIYAEDHTLRMVKIDGVARHEGDQLPNGFIVERISEIGVVLNRGSQSFEYNVVEDWQL